MPRVEAIAMVKPFGGGSASNVTVAVEWWKPPRSIPSDPRWLRRHEASVKTG
jgi:hypothetical protein